MKQYEEVAQDHTPEELEIITNEWGMSFDVEPDRETPEFNTVMISCYARGTTSAKHFLLPQTSPYLTTGAVMSIAAQRLLDGKVKATGFQPARRAFGHRELMAGLAEDGLHCWSETVS